MLNFCISAVASNQGKTILTTALLYYFKNFVRPFKIGPDYIDPQFHKMVSNRNSINLDTFMMNSEQVKWLFNKYRKKINILEGVMGFYDGEDKGCSTYGVSKILQIPTILILDGSGSYITISAILQGLKNYKKDNTIKAVVINKLSSQNHYELIKKQLNNDHKDIEVLGWIAKNIKSLENTHLGLDLENLNKIKKISRDVLKNIDLDKLKNLSSNKGFKTTPQCYPFLKIKKVDKKLTIVNDRNFSFLYYDNLEFLKEIFREVVIIDSTQNQKIPKNSDIVYICGGYVENETNYKKIKNSNKFRKSLVRHSKKGKIYAECAGLLYLGNRVEEKKMSGILDINFGLGKRFQRLGYYYNEQNVKGHAFHYTYPINSKDGFDILSKQNGGVGFVGSWSRNKIFATYLHVMFRNNNEIIGKRFL